MPDHLAFIENLKETYTGKTCYVACSGGVDSMLLLNLLIQAELNPIALHVNYCLRGEDSTKDQDLVVSFCKERGLSYQVHVCNLSSYKGNIQLKAREVRYAFFQEHIYQTENSLLFLGHHADDQLETFFINLARNAGMNGLSGIKERNGPFVRPLLSLKKKTIYSWAASLKLMWREDRSNADSKYTRNKLRNIILPALSEQIPSLETSVQLLQQVFYRNYLSVREKCVPIAQGFLNGDLLPVSTWQNLLDTEKSVFLSLISCKAGYLKAINKLTQAQKGSKLRVSNEFVIYREEQGLVLHKGGHVDVPYLIIEHVDMLPKSFTKDVVYLNPDKIRGTLVLRPWEIGDRIASIGLRGSQLVSDVLSTAKIPSFLKEKFMVVVDDHERVLWIPGHKVSRLAIADEKSPIIQVRLMHKSQA